MDHDTAVSSSSAAPDSHDDDDAADPFGSHAEVDHRPKSTALSTMDPRASVDSLTLAMGLAADLDAQAAGQP